MTGATTASPKTQWRDGALNVCVERSSADPRLSTPWPMCAATAVTMRAGLLTACATGRTMTFCRIFRKQESWEGGASAYRGGDGPLATRKSQYQDPLVDAYLQAAAASGYALNEDYNGETQDGFGRMQMTIRRGRRDSAATAYLHPVLTRKNLTIQVRAQVTRILMEGT